MNGKRIFLAGGAVVLVGALIFFYAAFQQPEASHQTPAGAAAPVYPAAETTRAQVNLYFSGPDLTSLVAETRELPDSGDPAAFGKKIIQALIDGPRGKGVRTLPATTEVRDVFITGDGTAYVDFNEKISEDHPGGVRSERLSIYSVVDSLVLNLENISAVKILIDGREADTLAGHMDLRFPYKANILLIK